MSLKPLRSASLDGMPEVGANQHQPDAPFGRQVRDALAHLYDLAHLQTHPLTRLLSPDPSSRQPALGRRLRQALLEAIDALRPRPNTAQDPRADGACQILTLRYVEGLTAQEVQERLAISRSEFYREQQRALDAIVSLLRELWGLGDTASSISHLRLVKPGEATPEAEREDTRCIYCGALPSPPTSFVGREREVAEVACLLSSARLLTLFGPPGTGKTRLALAVAAQVALSFRDGVHFVPLAAARDPDLVVPTIAASLGIRDLGSRPVVQSLANLLREKQTLLLLDNFEQVPQAAGAVAELLAACADLKVLVTSRALLQLYGEHSYLVPPLALPDCGETSPPDPDGLDCSEAVQLFIERARAARHDFALTAGNARAVAEICRRLDGLPLAIELAAARTKLLSLDGLLCRLSNRLSLLVGGPMDLPLRQQTLRAAIAWSYDLLEAPQQALFRRLALFVGGCTVEAAEAVGEDLTPRPPSRRGKGELQNLPLPLGEGRGEGILSPQSSVLSPGQTTLEGLESLVASGLLGLEPRKEGEPRFRMLETVREFALEALEAAGELEATRARYVGYYLMLAEQAAGRLHGPGAVASLNQLEDEHDNLRAALQYELDSGDAETALRLAVAVWEFWWVRGYLGEGLRWLEEVLVASDGMVSGVRAEALNGAGVLASLRGNGEYARLRFEESASLYRGLGDADGLAWAMCNLGTHALIDGQYARGRALLEEGLAVARSAEKRWTTALVLHNLAHTVGATGETARAIALLEESLSLVREVDDSRGIAFDLVTLAALLQTEHGDRAERYAAEALARCRELADWWGTLWALYDLGISASSRGQTERALRLFGAAEVLGEKIGADLLQMAPLLRTGYDQAMAAARAALDPTTIAELWAEGRELPLERAVAFALTSTPSQTT